MIRLQEKKVPKYQAKGKTGPIPLTIEEILSFLPRENSSYSAIPPNKAYPINTIDSFGINSIKGIDDRGLNIADIEKKIKGKQVSSFMENYNKPKNEEDQRLKNMLADKFKVITPGENKLGVLAGLIKPAIATGSALANLSLLKKTRDAALNIHAPRVQAAVIPNRPVQGLSPEITDLYLKNIGNLDTVKTSDETANRMAEERLNLDKMGALDKLSAAQVENLFKERARHDQIEGVNAQESVKALNEQNKYGADVANKQAEIKAGYESSKQDFVNKWIDEALVQPIAKREAYTIGKRTLDNVEAWDRLQSQLVNAYNRWQTDKTNPTYKNEYDILYDQQKLFGTTGLTAKK